MATHLLNGRSGGRSSVPVVSVELVENNYLIDGNKWFKRKEKVDLEELLLRPMTQHLPIDGQVRLLHAFASPTLQDSKNT